MELRNVLDQLKEIAEGNDSEDVARAIETAEKYTDIVERVETKEVAEETIEEEQVDEEYAAFEALNDSMNPIAENPLAAIAAGAAGSMIGDALSGDDDIEESPGSDDQYCARCGNTGKALDNGMDCPNCEEGDALERVRDRVEARGTDVEEHCDGYYESEGDDDWEMQGGEDGLGPDGDGRHDRQQYNDYGEDPWGLDETVLDESVPLDLADIKQRIMDMTKLLSGGGLDKATLAAAGEKKNRLGQMANFMQHGMEREEAASKAGIQ